MASRREADAKSCDACTDTTEDDRRGSSSSSDTAASSSVCGGSGSDASPQEMAELEWATDKKPNSGAEKPKLSELEMMKERFAKLLLGEDMSGGGKGVCTALAISNAITNLSATVFGQLWRLEPLAPEKKAMWQREMEWLLGVADHIVELIPSWQTLPDGGRFEIMTSKPREDLSINLPALRKLDRMLIEILDGFSDADFWYADHATAALAPHSRAGSDSFLRAAPRCRDDKWWLPVPQVPSGGLAEATRHQLQHKRDSAQQILKAAVAINASALADMDVPESYLGSLPKNGRASLGYVIYRYISSEHFSPECLLDCLDLSSDHRAVEIANRVEAAIHVWRRRVAARPAVNGTPRLRSRTSWAVMRDVIVDAERWELLLGRAEGLLMCLKRRCPGLTQTTLDMSKIQFNKDVGKSILESYSRVLESLASNIIARIDDVICMDDQQAQSAAAASVADGKCATDQKPAVTARHVPASGTPFATACTTPSLSPTKAAGKLERAVVLDRRVQQGKMISTGVRRVLVDHLGTKDYNWIDVQRS